MAKKPSDPTDITSQVHDAANAPASSEKLTITERLTGVRKTKDPMETPTNRMLDSVKEGFTPSDKAITDFIQALSSEEEGIVRDFMRVELGYIIRDAIAPYEISDNYFTGSAVVPFVLKDFFDASVNLQELVLDYMIGDKAVYSRVVLNDTPTTPITVVMPISPDAEMTVVGKDIAMQATITVAGKKEIVPVSHACVVKGNGGNATKRVLLVIFRLLVSLYASLKNVSDINRKVFVHLDGLSSIMEKTSITPDAQLAIMNNVLDQARAIMEDEIVVLDKNAEIKIAPVSFAEAQTIIDFIYSEMARVLKVPQTKLVGSAPQGLNATGEYDDKNYQDTLLAIRKNVIEPTLSSLGYEFQFNYDITALDFHERIRALLEMNERDRVITIEGKKKIALKLLPWLDEADLAYTSEEELAARIEARVQQYEADHQEVDPDA